MKTADNGHTTNYRSTFIQVAEDCPAAWGTTPPNKAEPTVAQIQFDLISQHPYRYTSDEVIFAATARKRGWSEDDREAWKEFFSRGQACLRASPLGKNYGWGIHHDDQGRVALVGLGTDEYERLSQDPGLKQLRAMRSSRG